MVVVFGQFIRKEVMANMFGRHASAPSVDANVDINFQLKRENHGLKLEIDRITNQMKQYENQNIILISKLHSVDTLKSLSSLNGLFSSKAFDFDRNVTDRVQEYILSILDFLLQPLD